MQRMQQYLDTRYQQLRRINQKAEAIWEDVTWQQLSSLRVTLEGEKAFGPVRFHVAETLVSDDARRIREFFSSKSQQCLLGEIVESKEGEGHKTHGAMEIHDMRTLFRSMDPHIESIVALVQTFIWWDLEDAADMARFEKKIGLIQVVEQSGLDEELTAYYREQMQVPDKPLSPEEVISHEVKALGRTVEGFRARRETDRGYQVIVARETTQVENPDLLIPALANQLNLFATLSNGSALDPGLAEQFGKAMGIPGAQVTNEKARTFLENTINGNKKRLRNALAGGGSGSPYNFKRRQLDDIERRYVEVRAGRGVEDANAQTIIVT